MVRSSTILVALAATAGPAFALPGKRQSVPASTPAAPASTAPPAAPTAAASPQETIYVGAIGEGVNGADGGSNWLTWWMKSDAQPDWCNLDTVNSSHEITDLTVKQGDPPPNIFYSKDAKDPDYMDGCSFDSSAGTWGCEGWSIDCDLTLSNSHGVVLPRKNIVGDPTQGGKVVASCVEGDDENVKVPVRRFYSCVRDASASQASQTIVAPSSGSSTSANPAYTSSCAQKYKDLDHWKSEEMDDFLEGIEGNIPKDFEGSFIDWLNENIEGTNTFECDFSDSADSCQSTDTDCAKGDNPRYYFVKTAVSHYFKWVAAMLSALDKAKLQFAATDMSIAQDFIDTDLPDASEGLAMTLLAGVLGSLSGMMGLAAGAVPSMGLGSAAAGAASGDSTVANGVISSSMGTADQVIQNELKSLAGMQDFVSNMINDVHTVVHDWGDNILNGAIKDQTASSSLAPHSAVGILKGGGFASDPLSSKVIDDFNDASLAFMWSSAIGWLWASQNVYIVKVTGQIADDVDAACDMTVATDVTRVCDGDTAYFITPYDNNGLSYSAGTQKSVPGADDDTLKKYNLDLLTMVKGAKATQDKFGFVANLNDSSTQNILSSYQNSASDINQFVAVPVCDLDAIEDVWKPRQDQWDPMGNGDFDTFAFVVRHACGQFTVTVDDATQTWPFSEDKFPMATTDGDWLQ